MTVFHFILRHLIKRKYRYIIRTSICLLGYIFGQLLFLCNGYFAKLQLYIHIVVFVKAILVYWGFGSHISCGCGLAIH